MVLRKILSCVVRYSGEHKALLLNLKPDRVYYGTNLPTNVEYPRGNSHRLVEARRGNQRTQLLITQGKKRSEGISWFWFGSLIDQAWWTTEESYRWPRQQPHNPWSVIQHESRSARNLPKLATFSGVCDPPISAAIVRTWDDRKHSWGLETIMLATPC